MQSSASGEAELIDVMGDGNEPSDGRDGKVVKDPSEIQLHYQYCKEIF